MWGVGEALGRTHAPYFALPCPSQTYSTPTMPKKMGWHEGWAPGACGRGRGRRKGGREEVEGRREGETTETPTPRPATIRRAGGEGSKSPEGQEDQERGRCPHGPCGHCSRAYH